MILVIDVPTNRIIYYTTNTTEPLLLSKNTVIVQYSGPWPEEITPTTSWNWVYVDNQVKHGISYKNEQGLSLLEINREAFSEALKDRAARLYAETPNIDLVKLVLAEARDNIPGERPLISTLAKSIGDSEENIIGYYQDIYSEYTDKLRCIEFVKNRFLKAFSLCYSNSELIFLNNELQLSKMSPKYVDSKDRYLVSDISNIDTTAILQEILSVPAEEWSTSKIDSRQETSIIQLVRSVPIPDKEYPENIWDSRELTNTDMYDRFPLVIQAVTNIATSRGEKLRRIMITKLNENEEVFWSTDIGKYYADTKRFRICVSGSHELSVLNKSKIMSPGDVVLLNNRLPHMVQQIGPEISFSIVFDTEK